MKRPLLLACLGMLLTVPTAFGATPYACAPTPPDAEGPFYRIGAPVRNRIGSGYLLLGTVKSALDCKPIGGARIEIWMTGPDGRYGDPWRATVFSRQPDGRYYFSSHVPPPYGSRPPHIHFTVNAPGFAELITQHYPIAGQGEAVFDLVLIPKR